MPIFSQGYQRWKGQLHGPPFGLLAVAALELKIQVRNVWFWIAFALELAVVLVMAAVLYIMGNGFPGSGSPGFPAPFMVLTTRGFFYAVLMLATPILVALVGSGAIARDRRFNAHLLYFSKALSPGSYLVGKNVALWAIVYLTCAVPALFFFGSVADCVSEELAPWTLVRFLFALLVHAGLSTFYYLALVLVFSSLTKNRSLPGILFFAAIWILWLFGTLFDLVHVVRAEDEMGPQASLSSASIDGEGRPVAVQVVNFSTRTVRREVVCRRPADFHPDSWLSSKPQDWLSRWPSDHDRPRLAADREGKRLFATAGGRVLVWDAPSGERLATIETPGPDDRAIAAAPDGSWFALGGAVLEVRDARTGEVRKAGERRDWPAIDLSIDRDGKRIAAACDRGVRVWRAAALEVEAEAKLDGAVAVAFAPDGSWIAAALKDGRIEVIDPANGKSLRSFRAAASELSAVAVSPDGQSIAWGSSTGGLGLVDSTKGEARLTVEHSPYQGVKDLAFASDGSWLASAGEDGRVLVWDPAGGNQRLALAAVQKEEEGPFHFPAGATGVVATSGGAGVAAVLADRSARIWDAKTGEERQRLVGEAWHLLQVEEADETWTATPYEWIRVANPFALVTRAADAFYPAVELEKETLGEVAQPAEGGPAIALPWWQVAGVCLLLIAAGYALVLYRLRSFERRQG